MTVKSINDVTQIVPPVEAEPVAYRNKVTHELDAGWDAFGSNDFEPLFLRPDPRVAELEGRIKELEDRIAFLQNSKPSIVGWPWDSPYADGIEAGKSESQEQLTRVRASNARLVEALEKIAIKPSKIMLRSAPEQLNFDALCAREALAAAEQEKNHGNG